MCSAIVLESRIIDLKYLFIFFLFSISFLLFYFKENKDEHDITYDSHICHEA